MQESFYTRMGQHTPTLMEPGRRAAVLLPFVASGGEWHIVLEERARTLRHQPGEICLPGGMVEPGESPRAAALRETCEELLVGPSQLELWGAGDLLHTPAGMTLHPYLVRLSGYRGGFSAQEVHSVFTVPASWLLAHPPMQYTTRLATCPEPDFPYERVPGGRAYPWRRGRWPVYFYEYQGRTIWGITAKILCHTLELVQQLGGLPPVEEQSSTI